MVWSYLFLVVAVGIISFAVCFRLRKWAILKNITQRVRDRDIHSKPLPRIGGLGIFISFWLVVTLILVFSADRLKFVDETVWGLDRNLFGVLLGALIIASVMLYDDIKGVKWSGKLLAQFLAGFAVAGFGVTINWINNPFDSLIHLDQTIFTIGNFSFSWGQLFVVLWIVLIMNVVNWLDGVDGLASGVVIIATLAIFLLAISPRINQPAVAILAIILAGSVFGFLPFNFSPARMFLGDTGSMFLGYMLAILAIISGGKVATASLIMGLPLLDGIWVVSNRLIHHKSPFEADQNHIHHRLMRAGLTVKQTVLMLYAGSIIFGYVALRTGPEGKFWALIWLIGVMLFLSGGLVMLEWIRRIKKDR